MRQPARRTAPAPGLPRESGGRHPGSQKPGHVLRLREHGVEAATFSSSAATGTRKAESNYRMYGHEGNEAGRAATVAQARTGRGHRGPSLALLVVGVPACRPPGAEPLKDHRHLRGAADRRGHRRAAGHRAADRRPVRPAL